MAAVAVPTGVLERERELRALDVLLDDARQGRGRSLVIEAPAGLGKSTLVAHVATVASERGMVVLRAAGRELEHELGWGVARSLFEAWLLGLSEGERAEVLSGPAAPARMLFAHETTAWPAGPDAGFALVHSLFWLTVHAAERRPLLLVVDDMQWADEPSLRWLLYLVGRLEDQPIALLAATRPHEAHAGALLASLVSDPATSVLEPAPLSAAAVGALVRARVRDAGDAFCGRCFELTAGNPLFVRELVRAADPQADVRVTAERATASVTRLVLRRLRSLHEAAQALARAVAVFEGGVRSEAAGALAGLDPAEALEAADALARADILRAGDPLEFVHPLFRGAVYGALGRHERARLHARAAQLLRARHAAAEHVGAHLLHAAPSAADAAVEGLCAAAAEAMAHGVPRSAMAYLERALHEPPATDVLPDVLAELGRAELLAGDHRAIEHLRAAIDRRDDARARARTRLELGWALHDFARLSEACSACEQGLEELGDSADDDQLALDLQALWLFSALLLPAGAGEAQRRASAVVRRGPATTRAGRTLEVKALHATLYAGGTDEGGTAAELAAAAHRLWAGGRLLAEEELSAQTATHVAGWLSYCDEYDAAQQVLTAMQARARREGWTTYVAVAAQLLARQELWTGPLDAAIDEARTAVGVFDAGQQMYLPASVYCLARALIEADRPDEADTVLARLDAGRAPAGLFAGWRAEIAGRLAGHRGDAAAALAAHLRCGEVLAEAVRNPAMFHWRSEAGLAALRTGDRELAERLIGEELALAERFGAPRAIGVARRAAGLLARGEEAVRLLRSATELHAGCGAALEQALSLTELGGAIRRTGRPGDARGVLREAIGLADRLGAAAVARRARDELTRAGGRPPAARDTLGDLTPSERRVAELAAAGRTNREIADELFVTIKAVEWHLGNAYRKLDIRGRTQLRAALGDA